MTLQDVVYAIADELRALATLGKRYAHDEYDAQRYQKVLEASARLVASLEARSENEVLREYQGNFGHVSPLNGADAVVVRDERVLLVRRRDSGLWALPGGLVEVGDSLAGAAERELHEETGLAGRATRYLGVFDSRTVGTKSRLQLFHHAFLVEADGEPHGSNETFEAAFFDFDALPELHQQHAVVVPELLALLRSGRSEAIFR